MIKGVAETESVQQYLISDPHGLVGSTRSVRLRPRFTKYTVLTRYIFEFGVTHYFIYLNVFRFIGGEL